MNQQFLIYEMEIKEVKHFAPSILMDEVSYQYVNSLNETRVVYHPRIFYTNNNSNKK